MHNTYRPPLIVYVVWHPEFADGLGIAEALRTRLSRNLSRDLTSGAGINVLFRSDSVEKFRTPAPIPLEASEATAVVVLADQSISFDEEWKQYIENVRKSVKEAGLRACLYPVIIDREALTEGIAEQGIRWDQWNDSVQSKTETLSVNLTYSFCRLLRLYLEKLRRPTSPEEDLESYLRKVEIFLSHSKHDEHGIEVATAIRNYLHVTSDLSTFFDAINIPAGLSFKDVVPHKVRTSVVIAIHTNSYSSREWCRKEVIEAKKANVPLVVANCLTDIDERAFPYLGNVPVVRMDPPWEIVRIKHVIARLLDEVLKDFLWKCRVEAEGASGVTFIPRLPELISLTCLEGELSTPQTIVYPDPPLSEEELEVFRKVAPELLLMTITQWAASR